MTLDQIATTAATKMGRNDSYAIGIAQDFAQSRHQYVYDSFDWQVSQTAAVVTLLEPPNGPIPIPGIDRIISVRYWRDDVSSDSRFLDPVSTQFLYETGFDLSGSVFGEPKFYVENYDQTNGQRTITLYPGPDEQAIGGAVALTILGKKPYDSSATSPLIPYIDTLLVSYVTADLLETFKQVAKSQAKLAEADKELAAVQARDTPPLKRPRSSKVLTVAGNSLEELSDSVCDIIGNWELDTRISVKERIRRNYQNLWEMALWPESTVVARIYATDNEQIILPHYFDRVISVRPDLNPIAELQSQEVSIFFNIDPQIFERAADPIFFTMLPSIGVATLPPYAEPLSFFLGAGDFGGRLTRFPHFVPETVTMFVKGEAEGNEISETVDVDAVPSEIPGPLFDTDFANLPTTQLAYDTPITIAKPITRNDLKVYGSSSKRLLLNLGGGERERKFMRIWLLPNQSSSTTPVDTQSFLILGKRAVSPLVDDADTCQLRNVENILINAAAADMLGKMGNAALAATLAAKAAASVAVMIDGEINQNTDSSPMVIPYVEPGGGWDHFC